jgi:hypothetical protein
MINWGSMPDWITALAAMGALIGGYLTIRAKREDDRRADRLNRINRQLSDFYGKLSIVYEAGTRDWCSFIFQHGNDSKMLGRDFVRFFPFEVKEDEPITAFNPPPPTAEQLRIYRRWLKILFIKTNERMVEVINANADLVIGGVMPPVLVLFAAHVASVRLMQFTLDEEEAKVEQGGESQILDDWTEYVKLMAPYPGDVGHYINACFRVLKQEQEQLISTPKQPLTETEIEVAVKYKMWEIADYWGTEEQKARARAGQHYEYKPAPKPEPEPQNENWLNRWLKRVSA